MTDTGWKNIFEKAKNDEKLMNVIINDVTQYNIEQCRKDMIKVMNGYGYCKTYIEDIKYQYFGMDYVYLNCLGNKHNLTLDTFLIAFDNDNCWCGNCDHMEKDFWNDSADDMLSDIFDECYTCQDYDRDINTIYNLYRSIFPGKLTCKFNGKICPFDIFKDIFGEKIESGLCYCNFCGRDDEYNLEMMLSYVVEDDEKCQDVRNIQNAKECYESLKDDIKRRIPYRVFKQFRDKTKCWCGKCYGENISIWNFSHFFLKKPNIKCCEFQLSDKYDEELRKYINETLVQSNLCYCVNNCKNT